MSSMSSIIYRFVDYYSKMDSQPPFPLAELYHADAGLSDPFCEHHGLLTIQRYFIRLLGNVKHCRFTINTLPLRRPSFCRNLDNALLSPTEFRGETLALAGCSIVEVQDNLIIRQRNYCDAGKMLVEHLPLLGSVVRSVKRRMCS